MGERGGGPVGFALFHGTFSTWECRAGVWLEDLFVPPEHRRGGVGGALFSAVAATAFAGRDSNPPWFPSLMAFEHYDSVRTHLFEQARFGGSYDGNNQVAVRTAPVTYPTGYNMVYLSPDDVFLYGGGYGNIPNATGAFVAKVDPDTLEQDITVLQKISFALGGVTALDCYVARPGIVRVGDTAEVGGCFTIPRGYGRYSKAPTAGARSRGRPSVWCWHGSPH